MPRKKKLRFVGSTLHDTPFHLVDRSPWPFYTSLIVFHLPIALLLFIDTGVTKSFSYSLLILLYFLRRWWKDIDTEAAYEGMHTKAVQRGIRIGYILFIISEIMFFSSFFGSYFYYTMEPSLWIGGVKFASPFLSLIDPFALPLLNSALLLSSSVFVTFAHHELAAINKAAPKGDQRYIMIMILGAIILGMMFSFCQWYEYNFAQFSIQDTTFGSLFYLVTGFHGVHVLIGILFLTVTFFRVRAYFVTVEHHVGFEFAALYWHFVDAVWFFVYLFFYVYPAL